MGTRKQDLEKCHSQLFSADRLALLLCLHFARTSIVTPVKELYSALISRLSN